MKLLLRRTLVPVKSYVLIVIGHELLSFARSSSFKAHGSLNNVPNAQVYNATMQKLHG